jgi:hypothetical protein
MFGYALEQRPRERPLAAGRPPRRRPPRNEPYADGGIEPALEDLMTDPLTEAVMRRDGVSTATLRAIIMSAKEGLRTRSTLSE